jgi:hypothetical protein
MYLPVASGPERDTVMLHCWRQAEPPRPATGRERNTCLPKFAFSTKHLAIASMKMVIGHFNPAVSNALVTADYCKVRSNGAPRDAAAICNAGDGRATLFAGSLEIHAADSLRRAITL